jgi:hypothetical protein
MKTLHLPEINIPYSKIKSLIPLGIITAGIVTAFYFLFPFFELEMVKFLMILFFGLPILIIVTTVKILMAKPVLTLSPAVLWWKGTLGKADGYVPWTSIQRFEYSKSSFPPGSIRIFLRTGAHLSIPVIFLDKSPEEIISLLQNYSDVATGRPGATFLPYSY